MRSLPPKVLKELRELVIYLRVRQPGINGHNLQALQASLDRAITPKRAAAPARKRRVAKRASHREEMAGIREAVLERADDHCEACRSRTGMALQVDHMFGGSGRRRALQSVETCWALCNLCHHAKTNSVPDAASWLESFVKHCARHHGTGYAKAAVMAQARLESLQLQGRTGSAS